MKAVQIRAFGDPEVVTYEDMPLQFPKAHAVLRSPHTLGHSHQAQDCSIPPALPVRQGAQGDARKLISV